MKRRHYCYLLTRALPEGGCRYYVGIRTCPLGKTPETDTKYMGGGPWIRRAVKAHPGEFSKHIVETFDTIEEARELEHALVGLTTANSSYSYNLMEGGGGGGLLSEETKAKVSAAKCVQYSDPGYKAKHAAAVTKANRRPENRAKNSEGIRRQYLNMTPEQRAVRTVATAEASRTPEARARNRCAQLKRFERPAELEAQTERNREVARRPEVKAKQSVNGRKRFEDPAERARARAAALRPEVWARNSAGKKSYWASLTPERRAAYVASHAEGRRRAKAERERVAREVGLIVLALVAAEAA